MKQTSTDQWAITELIDGTIGEANLNQLTRKAPPKADVKCLRTAIVNNRSCSLALAKCYSKKNGLSRRRLMKKKLIQEYSVV